MGDDDKTRRTIPTHAYVERIGKCRVLSYHRNGYFFLLAPGSDLPLYKHRTAFRFL